MYVRHRRRTRSLVALAAVSVAAAAAPLAARLPADAQSEARAICYPIEGAALGSSNFGDPRGGGSRRHEGQDIMAPKMVPLQAAVDGVVDEVLYSNGAGNRLAIRDAEGWRYVYLHLNNDTPGTDDSAATRDQVFAPGIEVGATVRAGQVVAYNGDSGNAESSGAHLHFEIRRPGSGHWSLSAAINPYASLEAAPDCSTGEPSNGGELDRAERYAPFDTAEALVERQYEDLLGRPADESGLDYWSGRLRSGLTPPHGVVAALLGSPEAAQRTAPVARLYWAFFVRIPDSAGLQHWLGEYRDGTPLADIAQAFSTSAEFRTRYADPANADFVDLVYRNVLGRNADGGGRAYWTSELTSGARTRGEVMLQFSESREYAARMAEQVYVTTAYVAMLDRAPDLGGLTSWIAQGRDALARGIFTSPEYAARIARP